jgi:hypothetical protein
MNITDQEKKWFTEEGVLEWNIAWAVLNPYHKVANSLGPPTYKFLEKHGFQFTFPLEEVTKKAISFPWYIDMTEKVVYMRWNCPRREGLIVECLPSALIEFCSIPKVKAQLNARNLGII